MDAAHILIVPARALSSKATPTGVALRICFMPVVLAAEMVDGWLRYLLKHWGCWDRNDGAAAGDTMRALNEKAHREPAFRQHAHQGERLSCLTR